MKRVLRFLIKFYPAWWRRRYGRELEALLEDSGSSWLDVWDLFQGAMQMQMSKLSFGSIMTICGLAGLVVAGALAFSIPNRYESTAIFKIQAGDQPVGWLNEAAWEVLSPNSLLTIIKDQNLYPSEQTRHPLKYLIDDVMRPAIQIRPYGTGLAEVRFSYTDPATARKVTQAVAKNFAVLEIRDSTSPAQDTVARGRIVFVGLGIGLAFGLLMALILRRRTPVST